jgi:type I restriction enzyme M protein
MTIKKSDLYRSLWKSCDELRGGMDASQYKDYILTLLFVKYVSDKYENDKHGLIEIPDGGSFRDIWELKGKPNVGEGIDKVIGKLAEANDLRGVIDVAFFNDDEKLGKGKEMVDRLSKLVTIFNNLDFRSGRADGDDLLGDAYEYLMRHFATESGKSKGQFYTPAEVSRILAKVVGIDGRTTQNQSVYDPTAGSGSLLLKAADEAPHGLSVYGQEKDVATWALAKMNMILHGYETAELWKGDTITSPGFTSNGRLKLHDFVVANPPFSTKSWSSGINPSADEFRRFEYGVPPIKNGDYAFLLHAVASLKSTGKAAVILPHGVLFRPNTEATIRKNLLKNGLIKGVIGLPPNLFYGTGIPACIVVIDKHHATERKAVFLIDASRGFVKDGNKNRLRSQDIHKIVDTFNSQLEVEGYSRLVPLSEVESQANDYNLSLARYINSGEPTDLQDLDAHVHGGVPNEDLDRLVDYWKAFPTLRETLFEAGRAGYSKSKVELAEVKATIEANAEFQCFEREVGDRFSEWFARHRDLLGRIKEGTAPKPIIHEISEDLLNHFADVELINRYDVYECLMTYWGSVMQDDVYLVSAEGWLAAAQPHIPLEDQVRNIAEEPDVVIGSGKSAKKYKMDLVQPALIMEHYFAKELDQVRDLQLSLDAAIQELAEYVEEHGGEGGLIEDAVNDKGKVTLAAVTAQSRALEGDRERSDELAGINHCGWLLKTDAAARKALKDAQTSLDAATLASYERLTEDEVKDLVIDKKWFGSIKSGVDALVVNLVRRLADRVCLLEARYAETLPEMVESLRSLESNVGRYLDLLTGTERLPGFTAEWAEVCLGDHVTFLKTATNSRADLTVDGPVRYLHYGDIHTSERVRLDARSTPMPRLDSARAARAGRLRVGDVVFVDASEDLAGVGKSVEITGVPDGGVIAGLHTIAARFDPATLVDGFKGYLQFCPEFRGALIRLAAGTKVLATSKKHIASISMRLPPLDEQRAIADVLLSIDAELDALERRLDKTRTLKLGVLQVLLTDGREAAATSR